MKLGAQFYSLRHVTKTPEALADTFRRVREIGFEASQMSGIGKIDATRLRDIAREFSLPITCTHSPLNRILGDTDALIAEHLTYGAQTIGLGSMPAEYYSEEGLRAFAADLAEPIRKIKAAGLYFAYHNHHTEFDIVIDGHPLFDRMIEDYPDIHFILDTYWVTYAGYDPVAYIRKIGGDRLQNIHYKDLARDDKRSICACGDGTLDFTAITAACEAAGVQNVLVEQDNAPSFPDAFEQMARSFRYLDPIIHHTQK